MQEQSDFTFQAERFADIQLLRYQVPGFKELTLRQKLLIYHLSRAALLGRDILWDQNGAYNLRIRQVLETIYTQYQGNRNTEDFQQFTTYLKRVWFSNGIHHHYGYQKFTPGFSENFFTDAAEQLGLDVEDLLPIIFDPSVLSKRVNQTEGADLLLTSASNYYQDGITQAEAEDFYASQKAEGDSLRPIMYGMNSRLEKKPDGTLYENIWRSGGLYGPIIERIIASLKDALPYAENPKQHAVIEKLIEFYQTGNLKTFDEYTILWVQDTESHVDFTNGFTEVYGDPLGLKASWEGYVNFIDPIATRRSQALSDNAQWFEDHSPIDSRFRKKECKGVSAKVINAAILGGDLYPSSAIGINLPNSNWVRAEYGSKSVTIGNLTHAYAQAAKGSGLRQEFVIDPQTIDLLDKYDDICDDLHTDLHECLGHGSGQLLPGVDPDALKAYGSTIEEARADLFGLYYLADEKLVELGLTPNTEAYKAQYYSYLMNGALTQLVRIEKGDQIEEAHMRNRALIARWVLKNFPQAAELTEKDGKHYIQVHSYPMLRTAFATLLAEIQRIKSEGDLSAARQLVEEFGVQVDKDLHQEVLERYKELNISPYKGFINPQYELIYDAKGNVTDVEIRYGEAYDHQMLRYGKL
ncbi:MAG: dihydrofolate reductase [Bacteroidaceae bacterium]|nr:dihydrofolate reductase [Bacteroidaceae bacterium]